MATERIDSRAVVFEHDEDKTLIRRRSPVARFDTVVYNPEAKVLEVWRYRQGKYQGEHEVVFSIQQVTLIRSRLGLLETALLISETASLYAWSTEDGLPEPWWGVRFI